MTEALYWVILFITDGLILFLGLHLLLGSVSKNIKGGAYHRARKLTGVCFTITPILGFIYYYLRTLGYASAELATAVNLTAYMIVAVLFAFAFLFIIGHKSDDLKRTHLYTTILLIVYLTLVWVPLLADYSRSIEICHIAANILLGVYIILINKYVHTIYHKAIKRIDNYYSDEVQRHINWVHNSIYLFIGLAVIAFISPFSHSYSLWLCLFYTLYQLSVFMYIYISVQNFELATLMLSLDKEVQDTEAIPVITTTQIPISDDTTAYIKKRIDEWIRKEEYRKTGITVKSVAAEICTNRTYLSSYINNTYSTPFKIWITQLRINDAKKLLCETRTYTNSEIAEIVGFPSASAFIHNFTNIEEVSPMKWKESNQLFIQTKK